jgi:hypothetical protein
VLFPFNAQDGMQGACGILQVQSPFRKRQGHPSSVMLEKSGDNCTIALLLTLSVLRMTSPCIHCRKDGKAAAKRKSANKKKKAKLGAKRDRMKGRRQAKQHPTEAAAANAKQEQSNGQVRSP